MPLSTTANYTQFGSVNVPGLSIDNPASFGTQTLILTLGFQAQGRGRFTAERINAPNIRGGNAGIWYQELNWMQMTGVASEINAMLGALTYHADPNGFASDHVVTVTLTELAGSQLGSGTIQFTHRPLYDNPPLDWTEVLGVNRQYAQYTPNTNQTLSLPAVGFNDATMLRMSVEALNTVDHFTITAEGNYAFNLLSNGNTVLSNVVDLSEFINTVNAGTTVSGNAFFRWRAVGETRAANGEWRTVRIVRMDRFNQNEQGVVTGTPIFTVTSGTPRVQQVSVARIAGDPAIPLQTLTGSGITISTFAQGAGTAGGDRIEVTQVQTGGGSISVRVGNTLIAVGSSVETLVAVNSSFIVTLDGGRAIIRHVLAMMPAGVPTATVTPTQEVTATSIVRTQAIRGSTSNHLYGTIVRMLEESNQSTEWDGRLTLYAPRSAINTALFRTRWQPRSYNGVARFRISVTDGKGNTVSNDLFRYSDLGSLWNRSQSMTLVEDGPAVDMNTSTPWWIIGPNFGTGFARYTAEIRQSDRFAATITPKRSANIGYGSATVQWIPPAQTATANQVGGVQISNGTRGRRGGFRWRVGDTARLAGGTGTQATVRIDQIVAPFQIPYQTMTTFITAAGSGYAVNDFVTLDGGTTTLPHRMRVTSVNAGGGVTGLVEEGAGGGNYTVLPALNTALTTTRQTGNGTGLTITLPSNMPLAGSASVVSVLTLGNYTGNPPLVDNEVTPLSGAAGFWLQLNVTMGTADPGGYLRIEGTRNDVNNVMSDLSIILAPDYTAPFTITNTVTSTLGLNTTGTMSCVVAQTADRTILSNGNISHTWQEDQTYTFAPPFFVSDLDPDPLTFTASLTAAAGALSSAAGGSWNAATRVWTASGLQAPLNTIIAGLRFAPSPNFDTSFSIVVRVGDAGGTLAMIPITSPDPTVVTSATSYIYNPQSKTFLTGPPVTVQDPDTNDVITLTASPSVAGAGLLNSDGSGWTRLGTNGLRMVGSASLVNTILSSLSWTANATSTNILSGSSNRTWTEDVRHAMPNFVNVAGSGFDSTSFDLSVVATSNSGDSSARTFAIVPDANYVPGQIQLVLTMPLAAGALQLPAVAGSARTNEGVGPTTRTYTITGVDRDVNAILSSAAFVPSNNYEQSFTINAAFAGNTASIVMNCIAVDDATVISAPPTLTYQSGLSSSTISPIQLSDVDGGEILFVDVAVDGSVGSLTATGPGWTTLTNSLQIAGAPIATCNQMLANMRLNLLRVPPELFDPEPFIQLRPDGPLAIREDGFVARSMYTFFPNGFFNAGGNLRVTARRSISNSTSPVSTATSVLRPSLVHAPLYPNQNDLRYVASFQFSVPYDAQYTQSYLSNSRSRWTLNSRTLTGDWPNTFWRDYFYIDTDDSILFQELISEIRVDVAALRRWQPSARFMFQTSYLVSRQTAPNVVVTLRSRAISGQLVLT